MGDFSFTIVQSAGRWYPMRSGRTGYSGPGHATKQQAQAELDAFLASGQFARERQANLIGGALTAQCAKCGGETPLALLDAKPGPGTFTRQQLNEAADRGDGFDRLECATCYGPGYQRMGT